MYWRLLVWQQKKKGTVLQICHTYLQKCVLVISAYFSSWRDIKLILTEATAAKLEQVYKKNKKNLLRQIEKMFVKDGEL